jgi:hypothetical protein
MADSIIGTLLKSDEPSVRFKVLTNVLHREPSSREIKQVREEIRASQRIERLLSERTADGRERSRDGSGGARLKRGTPCIPSSRLAWLMSGRRNWRSG